ncbi:GreA/GreB family elongation factor [Patescibacteria group bacterium]|nr:GreA/GreB family elongation factor [Patescibacteria group bacterium]
MEELKTRAFTAFLDLVNKDLQTAKKGKKSSEEDAKNASHAMESRYDSFREEAEALAGGHEKIEAELEDALSLLSKIKSECIQVRSKIAAGALITLEDIETGEESNYYVIPNGSGRKLNIEDTEFTCISPQTPLGQKLIQKEEGDEVIHTVAGVRKTLEITKVL